MSEYYSDKMLAPSLDVSRCLLTQVSIRIPIVSPAHWSYRNDRQKNPIANASQSQKNVPTKKRLFPC